MTPLLGIIYIWTITWAESNSMNALITKKMYERILMLVIFNFILTLFIMHLYDSTHSGFQLPLYINDKLIAAVDGISLWLVFLTNLIIPIVILSSWRSQGVMTRTY